MLIIEVYSTFASTAFQRCNNNNEKKKKNQNSEKDCSSAH